ncbi:hypothetical protein OIDMADRAFT_110086 [Oidiodendron maius Zn]|uniref:SNF2 family DNA-dependent ATPase domain-containing protein n=1 Tax=Oidiodendron maius (strain Zn) TaxID=913774 RepID=A0A0C3E244_OIDMZ|nr:hypothetical protein OIDMADRAFT_110086 [Oidiodendron maius Zn]
MLTELIAIGRPPSNNPPNVNGTLPSFAAPKWSPASLLHPRGFPQGPQAAQNNLLNTAPPQRLMFQFDSPQGSSHSSTPNSASMRNSHPPQAGFEQYANGNGPMGMGHMLERMHNVASRDMLPQKRRKIHDDRAQNDQKKAEFNGAGRGGVIGEYMKEKKEQGQKESIPIRTAVDISAVDDNDVQAVVSAEDKEVCYGRIEGAEINAHKVPTPRPGVRAISDSMWPQIKIVLRRRVGEKTTVIYCVDSSREIIGCVDVSTSIGLAPLLDSKFGIRTASRILSRQRQPNDLPCGADESRRYGLDLNLYGPKKYALQVGRHLSQKQLWLRTPLFVEAGIQVHNPHEIQRPPAPPSRSLNSYSSRTQLPQRTTEEIRNDVLGMFDSLTKSENLPEMDADPRITTELLKHQRQGLYFMTNKEKEHVYGADEKGNSSLWRLNINANGQKSYYNVITGQELYQSPPQVLGGLLADMMGLGKTLAVLSLVVHTLDAASEWATLTPGVSIHSDQSQPKKGRNSQLPAIEPTSLIQNSKATLLVSPLSTISNWEDQIKQHIKPGTLKYYIYHGASRIKDIKKLAEYDLVITTYGSVASEFNHRCKKKQGTYPLEEINWFRIVLDEAHMIREQSTQQSKAICRLAAQRRWAVTGTPVQNRLEDLGALMTFLRIRPFDERGGFAQYIMAPFKLCDPEILPKLRLLVDSITLRRLKDRIDLPPRHDKLVKLNFSPDEQMLYDIFSKNAQDRVKVITAQGEHVLGGKSYVHILQSILRLRLICAHGRDLLGEEDLKVMDGLSKDSAIDLDSDDDEDKSALTPKQAYDMFNLMKQTGADICVACNGKIGCVENLESDTEPKDEVIAHMTLCYHIVCNACIIKWKSDMAEIAAGSAKIDCPVCHQNIKLLYFELRQCGLEDELESRAETKSGTKRSKEIHSYSGPHTKTKALIQDLLSSKEESLRNPSEPPIKSVVFSGWTVHLDLIQLALQENGICYTRLDGRMSRTSRSAALDAFRNDLSIHVILVSITAGGLGLNLTTANKVYVMEPQYNPAAEAQAVDRVHRLGQKRPVETTRYIIRNSFEEKMLELQDKKKKLASLSMDSEVRKTMDKAEAARKRLEDIRSLFR